MHPPAARTVSRVKRQRSHLLIDDSRALIASAQELLHQTRQALARQRYLKIVCAWCQQTIRWKRCEQAARGQISHGICFACFADVFQELAPGNAMFPFPTQGDMPHERSRSVTLAPRPGAAPQTNAARA